MNQGRYYIGKLLKEHPNANLAHRILRFDHTLLVAYCGQLIPIKEASTSTLGVLICSECSRLWKLRIADKEKGKSFDRRASHVSRH
jgi:hypothetical protein